MDQDGYAIVSNALPATECDALVRNYDESQLYRKTIQMERYRFGKGEYRYFDYPLPSQLAQMRADVYELLSGLANTWNRQLNLSQQYPDTYQKFLHLCHHNGQQRATPLILRYTKGCYNTLHQDLYGDIYFPFQAIVALSQPEEDYEGGQIVLTEQRPRSQSRAIVLTPNKGDMVIIPTNFRPQKGVQKFYKLTMRHGVSKVTSGTRYTLGIILHDSK